jgi:hypothetical protein
MVQILYILHDNLLVPRCFHYKYKLHYETKLGIFSAVNLKRFLQIFYRHRESIYGTKVTSKKYVYDIHCIDFDFCYDVHRGYGKDLIEI